MTICLKYGKIKYVCKKLPQKNDLLRRYKEEADMSLLQAILMGIIQGLTEFLPVFMLLDLPVLTVTLTVISVLQISLLEISGQAKLPD